MRFFEEKVATRSAYRTFFCCPGIMVSVLLLLSCGGYSSSPSTPGPIASDELQQRRNRRSFAQRMA